MHLRVVGCCGGGELYGINETDFTPMAFLSQYARDSYIYSYAGTTEEQAAGRSWIVFSIAWPNESSEMYSKKDAKAAEKKAKENLKAWVDFIQDNQLGEIVIPDTARPNPNMRQRTTCHAGLWIPDNAAVMAYLAKSGKLKKEVSTKNNIQSWLDAMSQPPV